jgi:hypothetical protein
MNSGFKMLVISLDELRSAFYESEIKMPVVKLK